MDASARHRSPRLHDNDSSTAPSTPQRDDPYRPPACFHSLPFLEDGKGPHPRLESSNSPQSIHHFERFLAIRLRTDVSRCARDFILYHPTF